MLIDAPRSMKPQRVMLLGIFLSLTLISSLAWSGDTGQEMARVEALNQQIVQLMGQGRYDDAIPLATEAVAILEKTLGPDHPDVANGLGQLAGLYLSLGRYAEAEPLFKRSLAIDEKALEPTDPGIATDLGNLAVLYVRRGRYTDAEPLLERSLAIDEKALGPTDPGIATDLANLAALYFNEGRYADAEPLLKRSLEIREKALGPDHPEVAENLNNLAMSYLKQGRFTDAEPLLKRSLAIAEKAFGSDHHNVAAGLNNLAELYRAEGRYADAEPLYKRSLTIDEKAFGPDHPEVAAGLNNLAGLYQQQGRYADAELLYKRSLAIREKTLGPEHPDLAESLNNLGALYYKQGLYADAEPLLKRSLEIREKALGPDHPDVATNLNDLAELYRAEGRYTDAEPLYKRSLAIYEKTLGPEHPNVAVSLDNLASLDDKLGRYSAAELLYKRGLAIREKALGPDHPDVGTSLNELAGLYRNEARYADAETLYKRSLAIREKALGPDHPDVGTTLNELAELYRAEGRYTDAEPLYKRCLAIYEKAFGPDSPNIAASLNNLALLYANEGKYASAEPLYSRSLAITEKALGPEHPSLAAVLNNLAGTYDNLGRLVDAELLYRRSLAISEKALGPDHPDVAQTLSNLGLLYVIQGRYADAEPLYNRSLAITEKALGPDHPRLARGLWELADLYRKQHRIADAFALSGRAVNIVTRHIAVASTDRSMGDSWEQRQFRDLFLLRVALAYEQDKTGANSAGESFHVEQLASASSTAQAVAGMAARFAAGNDALAATVRERQDLAGRWQALDKAIVAAASRPPAERDSAAENALRGELAETGETLDALDARIGREFPAYAELSNPKPLEIGEAQTLLAADEAMLVYLVGDDATWLWVLRHDRDGFFRIGLGRQGLSNEVAALRNRLDPDFNGDLKPFDAKRAFALYQTIMAPAAPLLENVHQLLVVPDGALESLPLAVLLTEAPDAEPQNPVDHRGLAWLARRYAVNTLPSVGALRALRRFTDTAHAPAPFIGIGDPKLQGPPGSERGITLVQLFRGPIADVTAVRLLPPLPETADELRAVAKALGAGEQDLYLAERASEPLLRRAGLDHYRVVEFATHGLISGDLAGLAEPALVLTPPAEATPENDGLLTASKVATLSFNADWVVLSACNTASGDGTPDAESLSGLAKAFFYAGARSLLVSHWEIPSQATVKIVIRTFNELKKDPAIGRAEALRRAQMAMLDPASPPEFAHPMFWAPFVLAGEGGAGR